MDVALSPDMIHAWSLSRMTVVVTDILRASSSITAGIYGGVPAIRPVETVHRRQYWRNRGYLLGGERHGEMIDDFDLGNAPEDYLRAGKQGKKIIMTTTNGTRAVQASKQAEALLIGAFLNLNTIAGYLQERRPPLLIVCAGWRGKSSLEDTLFAGALIDRLREAYAHTSLGDGAQLALAAYERFRKNLLEAVQESSHGQRLVGLDQEQDVAFCLQQSKYPVLPVLRGEEIVAFG